MQLGRYLVYPLTLGLINDFQGSFSADARVVHVMGERIKVLNVITACLRCKSVRSDINVEILDDTCHAIHGLFE